MKLSKSNIFNVSKLTEEFSFFKRNTNLMFVVDHAGRAGNGFYQTIFDKHPEVIVSTWIHYFYSYLIFEYGVSDKIKYDDAIRFLNNNPYTACIFNKNENNNNFIKKMGGDPNVYINRKLFNKISKELLIKDKFLNRKNIIHVFYYALAKSINKEIYKIKYLLLCDSITTKKENIFIGYKGDIINVVTNDFPKVKLIHLTRDPRAGFASTNHQFINSLGNMYGIRLNNFPERFSRLIKSDLNWDSVFVFGFWVFYFIESYKTIKNKKLEFKNFISLKNEDLNLHFRKTMEDHSKVLGIKCLDEWNQSFIPTMFGAVWKGTGGYNNNYQNNTLGPLKNDSLKISISIAGPNKYVTERWKVKLKSREKYILEYLFIDELNEFKYEIEYLKKYGRNKIIFLILLFLPLSGEIPGFKWLLISFKISFKEIIERISYYILLPFFYLTSRIIFIRILKSKKLI